jgi:hypothetical protein
MLLKNSLLLRTQAVAMGLKQRRKMSGDANPAFVGRLGPKWET